jgi:hypothetical protein
MERRYQHSTVQLLAAAHDVADHHPAASRLILRWRIVQLLFGAWLIGHDLSSHDSFRVEGWMGVFAIVGSITMVPLVVRNAYRRATVRQFLTEYQHLQMRISTSDTHIVEEWEGGRVEGPWKDLLSQSETPLHLVLRFRSGTLVYVPKDVLDEAFLTDIRQRSENG